MGVQEQDGDSPASQTEESRAGTPELRLQGIQSGCEPGASQWEQKFTELNDSVSGMYIIQDNVFKLVNEKLAHIFRKEIRALVHRMGLEDLAFHEDKELVRDNLRKLICGDSEALAFEFRGVTRNGDIVHLEAHGRPIQCEGRPAVMGTVLDVTDRVAAKRVIEKELKKFQALYDLAVAMTAEHTLDENLSLVVNKARELLEVDKAFVALADETGDLRMHSLAGVVTEEFRTLRIPVGVGLGGKVAETGQWYVVEDYYQEVEPAFHDIMRAEGLLSGIAVPVNVGQKNLGVLYAFNREKRPFSKSDLDTLSLLGYLSAVEITRKRAEEQLRQSETNFRKLYEDSKRREAIYESVLNSSADAIVIYDMEGYAQYVNPSFTRIFGWTAEEVEGKRIPFLPDSEREASMKIIYGLVKDGAACSAFETQRYTKDGAALNISISASRFNDHEGNPAGLLVILRDITDKKLSERQLRESEENYRKLYEESKRAKDLYESLLNSSADAIVIYDMDGFAQYVNPSFTRIFGWTMQEVQGRRIPFVPDSERHASMEIIYGLIKDGTPCSAFETKRFTKDGRILDISISASRCHDHRGKPAGLLVILRNITDRKAAETALKESEERFRTLADVAPFAIGVAAADETAEYVNPKFTEIFGYRLHEIPDLKTWFRKAYPDEGYRQAAETAWKKEKERLKVGQVNRGGEATPRVFTVRCKDGTDKIISFRGVHLPDGRTIVTYLDITSEAKAQEEIVRAKNEWERTFNAVSDLIILMDTQQRIVRANNAVARRLGVPPEQVIGLRCSEQLPGGMTLASFCPGMGAPEDGVERSAEVTDESLDGVFDLRVSPLRDETGRVYGSVHVARDITAFKSMERARRLAVHHLAHELKTPLAVIKGSLKDLDDEATPIAARTAKIERIRRNLDRLADIQKIVDEIVAPREWRPDRLRLVTAVRHVVDRCRQKSAHRSIIIKTDVIDAETSIIDPDVFDQALGTLVKNAIENTPDEGEITVSVVRSDEGFLLNVRDEGVGIAAVDRQYLFEAFHHTQDTDLYATRNPFDFDAGGKGLELLRLKILAQEGFFDISFETGRCHYLPTNSDVCCGRISQCPHIGSADECRESGGSTFSVLFHSRKTGADPRES
jgi:two-component system phosphate regulon sensor histidine kinase PhoR